MTHQNLSLAKSWNSFDLLKARNVLRRNPLENRTISGLSGQKSGTRIILSIVRSFLHLLNANYIDNCLK